MPVIRTFFAKVKSGRMQDAMTNLSTRNRIVREAGAISFGAYHLLTGPYFPGLTIHAVYENYAAFGAWREQMRQHPEGGGAAFPADAPTEIVRALQEEPVYRAGGDDAGNWLAQTNVRFTIIVRPHSGRTGGVERGASRLADTIHQCGALAANVRRVIAGSDGPRIVQHSYHAGFAEFEATRSAVLESDVWTALSGSQDDSATRMQNFLCTRIAL